MKTRTAVDVEFWSANWWRENPQGHGDFALVETGIPDHGRPGFVAINEGHKYVHWARAVQGFTAAIPVEGDQARNNLALCRDDRVEYVAHFAMKMCDAVGTSPERWATIVLVRLDSGDLAWFVVTHANSHVQHGRVPHGLRRVGQYVVHMRRLKALVGLLRRFGLPVVVLGDFNWSWGVGVWPWSPHVVFHSLGMVSQWDHPTAPDRGSHGKGKGRRLDVVAYDPDEWQLLDQGYVEGEHSDHRWPRVVLRLIPRSQRLRTTRRAKRKARR